MGDCRESRERSSWFCTSAGAVLVKRTKNTAQCPWFWFFSRTRSYVGRERKWGRESPQVFAKQSSEYNALPANFSNFWINLGRLFLDSLNVVNDKQGY